MILIIEDYHYDFQQPLLDSMSLHLIRVTAPGPKFVFFGPRLYFVLPGLNPNLCFLVALASILFFSIPV